VRIAVTFDHRLINGAAAARFLDDLATELRGG
jgi:pyruvate/2-oxoglutarate dehydrogenase complex dihydrolipoamide acyltransferase (E2) component